MDSNPSSPNIHPIGCHPNLKLYGNKISLIPEGQIKLAWRKRLFSWPWKPWIKSVPFPTNIDDCYIINGNIFVTQKIFDVLKKQQIYNARVLV